MSNVFDTLASSMYAESIRMNISTSNIANAGSMGSSEAETYRAKHPVFSEVKNEIMGLMKSEQPMGGVRVTDIIEGKQPLSWRLDPDNPLADANGRVYLTDVNPIEEMADMISASRQYQADVDLMNTMKNLSLQTIKAISG